MTPAGWIMMCACWAFVIGLSTYLVAKNLRAHPRADGQQDAPPPAP